MTPETANYKKVMMDGLWNNNPALIQLLGLCPLLAVTTSFVNGFALGIASIFVLVLSNLLASLVSPFSPQSVRLPIYVLIIASMVTCVELVIQAYSFGLYRSLGIFLPLIVTNCTILGRVEAFASRNPPLVATLDGLSHGTGFAVILILLGSFREILGTGQIFTGLNLLGINGFDGIIVFGENAGFLLMILPPGGFILMGLFIALNNIIREYIDNRRKELLKQETQGQEVLAGSKRVRVSG